MEYNVIYKYAISPMVNNDAVPRRGEVVHIGHDGNGQASLWLSVPYEAGVEPDLATVVCVGTGNPFPHDAEVLGSYLDPPFVWHALRLPEGQTDV